MGWASAGPGWGGLAVFSDVLECGYLLVLKVGPICFPAAFCFGMDVLYDPCCSMGAFAH